MAFQGSLKELPLPDIIQLVSVSGKTGVFTLTDGVSSGEIYLRDGQIIHAHAGTLEGEEAVYELAIWPQGDFVFKPGEAPPSVTIKRSNTNLLMEAARRIDEWQVLAKRIGSTRLIPEFTERASKTSVSLTPAEWRLISKVDERRSIEEIALALGLSPFEACKNLYGLITSGLLSLKENQIRLPVEKLQGMAREQLSQLVDKIHQQARHQLGNVARARELEAPLKLCRVELEAGRRADALIDLVRSHERIVSATMGPNQSKIFLQQVGHLVQS